MSHVFLSEASWWPDLVSRVDWLIKCFWAGQKSNWVSEIIDSTHLLMLVCNWMEDCFNSRWLLSSFHSSSRRHLHLHQQHYHVLSRSDIGMIFFPLQRKSEISSWIHGKSESPKLEEDIGESQRESVRCTNQHPFRLPLFFERVCNSKFESLHNDDQRSWPPVESVDICEGACVQTHSTHLRSSPKSKRYFLIGNSVDEVSFRRV